MVHCFSLFDSNIAFDAETGSLHVMGDAAAALLGAWSPVKRAFDGPAVEKIAREHGCETVGEALDELNALVGDGQLYAPDQDAPGEGAPDSAHVFKSLCVHLAHDCNMRCAYCFASDGSYGRSRGLMGADTARAAIDFVTGASAGRTNIEIDFFGGEPLLNFGVLKQTVDYARKSEKVTGKKFRFTLTTNGLLLDDDVINYVNAEMDNLVLSIDGRKEVHDRVRKRPDGTGTYEDIAGRFKKITKDRQSSWYVRGTYTVLNRDFSRDVLHLADLGFDRISVEPVVSPQDPALGFTVADLDELGSEYEKLAFALYERYKSGRPVDFFHFNIDLEGGPCLARRVKGCGAGYEYAAVAPDGGLYPCHQFAGIDRFRLGSVFRGIENPEVAELFKQTGIYTKADCRACWAKYLCGGGCAANAWYYNQDVGRPDPFYCDLFRKRAECALWLKCAPYIDEGSA